MKEIFSGKIVTLPNLITMSRIVMIPFFIWTYVGLGNVPATVVILALSGLSDVLDGMIARKFNTVSNLGKAMDPVADKLTQLAMLFCLAWRFPHIVYVLALLFVKELVGMVTSLMAIQKTGEVRGADWHGKMTTVTLYLTMALHLLYPGVPPMLSDGLLILCGAMILLSGTLYLVRNVRMAREGATGEKTE